MTLVSNYLREDTFPFQEFCGCSLERAVDVKKVLEGNQEHIARVRNILSLPSSLLSSLPPRLSPPLHSTLPLVPLLSSPLSTLPSFSSSLSPLIPTSLYIDIALQVVVLLLSMAVQNKHNSSVISAITSLEYEVQRDLMFFIESTLTKVKSHAIIAGTFTSGNLYRQVTCIDNVKLQFCNFPFTGMVKIGEN